MGVSVLSVWLSSLAEVRLGGRGAIAGRELRMRGVGDGPSGRQWIAMLQAQVGSVLPALKLVAFQVQG